MEHRVLELATEVAEPTGHGMGSRELRLERESLPDEFLGLREPLVLHETEVNVLPVSIGHSRKEEGVAANDIKALLEIADGLRQGALLASPDLGRAPQVAFVRGRIAQGLLGHPLLFFWRQPKLEGVGDRT